MHVGNAQNWLPIVKNKFQEIHIEFASIAMKLYPVFQFSKQTKQEGEKFKLY